MLIQDVYLRIRMVFQNGESYNHIGGKEALSIGLRKRDGIRDLGAAGLLAEVSIADGRVAGGVIVLNGC